MESKKSILLVNDYGIYPELTKKLNSGQYKLTTENLMRKAIKLVKRNAPDLLILEFFHEPQFRDRVSNIESILAQLQCGQHNSKTLVLFYPGHEQWLNQLQEVFTVDASINNEKSVSEIISAIDNLL